MLKFHIKNLTMFIFWNIEQKSCLLATQTWNQFLHQRTSIRKYFRKIFKFAILWRYWIACVNAFIHSIVASAASLQKYIAIRIVLCYSRSESRFSKINRSTQIAVWMLTYACSVIQNLCFKNRDSWIATWKYPYYSRNHIKTTTNASQHTP